MKDATCLPSASSFEFSKLAQPIISRRFLSWAPQGIFYVILRYAKLQRTVNPLCLSYSVLPSAARRQFEFSARQNIAERVILCYSLHMKIKFVRKSAKTLDTRAARFSQLTANTYFTYKIFHLKKADGMNSDCSISFHEMKTCGGGRKMNAVKPVFLPAVRSEF